MASIVLTGWRPGLRKVSLANLLKDKCDLSLSQAKACVDRLVDGECVQISVSSPEIAQAIMADIKHLGAECEYLPD